jgi:hypothetical protein
LTILTRLTHLFHILSRQVLQIAVIQGQGILQSIQRHHHHSTHSKGKVLMFHHQTFNLMPLAVAIEDNQALHHTVLLILLFLLNHL